MSPVASNRLIVKADNNGDVCFYTMRPAAMIVDINAVSDVGISSFPNHRIDTRSQTLPPGSITSHQRAGVAAVHNASRRSTGLPRSPVCRQMRPSRADRSWR